MTDLKSFDNDFFVMPISVNQNFIDILNNLEQQKESLKWREIKEKFNDKDILEIIIETARELSITEKQVSLFRKSNKANEALIAIWLSKVLSRARDLAVNAQYNNFEGIDLEDLSRIASLCINPNSIKSIQKVLLDDYGIFLIIEDAFSGMKLDGIVTILNKTIPVIGLSLRYTRYDNFWFTLMHELSHIYLHYDRLENTIFDDLDNDDGSDIELEANRLATDILISRRLFNKSNVIRSRSQNDLLELAKEAKVHPSIAAGLVRNYLKNYQLFTPIVHELDVKKIIQE
jgi:HTH-type transcriptional regulator / antitoxin HigA